MRWAEQEISNEAGDPAALPGLDLPGLDWLDNVIRSVRTPEFAGIIFHEVLAKSALNHVPKAAGLPFNWTVNPYRGCSHGCLCYPEVLGKNMVLARPGPQVSSPLQVSSRSGHEALAPAPNRPLVWSRGRRLWTGSGVWPVRPRVTSSVITPRSSAHLKRPPLFVVLHSPFVAADYAEQISHGSPSSTSVRIGADVTRLWPYPSLSVLACLRVLSRGTR
jgi:hypothetical protein